MNDGWRLKYTKVTMGMKDPYNYFQAGVLVLNTAAMRRAHTIDEWLGYAANPEFIFNDQDVLNVHCEGHVTYLDDSWNITIDTFDRYARVYSFAPVQAYENFLNGRTRAKIVHYAGADKPWNTPGCDLEDLYWSYARKTPFYEELLAKLDRAIAQKTLEPLQQHLEDMQKAEASVVTHEKAVGEDSSLRKVFDPIMPVGSNRREVAKAIVRTLRGKK